MADDDDDNDELDLTKEFNKDEASHDPNSLQYLTAEFCNVVLKMEASKRAERFIFGNKVPHINLLYPFPALRCSLC